MFDISIFVLDIICISDVDIISQGPSSPHSTLSYLNIKLVCTLCLMLLITYTEYELIRSSHFHKTYSENSSLISSPHIFFFFVCHIQQVLDFSNSLYVLSKKKPTFFYSIAHVKHPVIF